MEHADAERAMDLLLELAWWIECTPEPQLELDTSVTWSESLVSAVRQWPPSTRELFRRRLLAMEASDDFVTGWLASLE